MGAHAKDRKHISMYMYIIYDLRHTQHSSKVPTRRRPHLKLSMETRPTQELARGLRRNHSFLSSRSLRSRHRANSLDDVHFEQVVKMCSSGPLDEELRLEVTYLSRLAS